MEKWCEITALVSYSIWTLWYYKMIPSNDFVKNFHNMESSIESWRFRTRSLCGLAPPTPCTIHLNVNQSRVPKEISIILQIKYIFTLGFQKQWRCQRQLFSRLSLRFHDDLSEDCINWWSFDFQFRYVKVACFNKNSCWGNMKSSLT